MGHDIKRIADDEWESGNPIDFRGQQTKNNFAQRAWSDFNDDSYLALGLDAMDRTGDESGEYARYNAGTDSRKALDIAHLNLDDYYGSHITGDGLPNSGDVYTYNAAALKVLPRDIGKLSTNEQGDIAPPPGGLRPNQYRQQRRAMGLPDIIPTITQPTVEPHEVEQEDEEPPELEQVGQPEAKPKPGEADIAAERMEAAAAAAASKPLVGGGGSVSSVAAGDAGGTVRFEREEELDTLRTDGGRTLNSRHPSIKGIRAGLVKGTPASEKARAKALAAPPSVKESAVGKLFAKQAEAKEAEEEGEGDEGTEATSRAGGEGGGFRAGHRFVTRKEELTKAFPGITSTRKNAKEPNYESLSTEQKKFLVSMAQGKPGKPSEDMMENYSIDQGAATERQHDYMMKMLDAHDKQAGFKGLTGWATNLTDIAREIPSLSLGKLFSLSPKGRDVIYTAVRAPGAANVRSLPDHDLDVLHSLIKTAVEREFGGSNLKAREAGVPPKFSKAELSVATSVPRPQSSSSRVGEKVLEDAVARLKAKGY
jgi:hypothetical protein